MPRLTSRDLSRACADGRSGAGRGGSARARESGGISDFRGTYLESMLPARTLCSRGERYAKRELPEALAADDARPTLAELRQRCKDIQRIADVVEGRGDLHALDQFAHG